MLFKEDCYRWTRWLYKSKRHFGLVVIDDVVTSIHIHLIVKAREWVAATRRLASEMAGRV